METDPLEAARRVKQAHALVRQAMGAAREVERLAEAARSLAEPAVELLGDEANLALQRLLAELRRLEQARRAEAQRSLRRAGPA